MKLVTRPPLFFCGKYQQCCQGQHLVICKTSNFWQEARASNVSSRRHQTCGRVMTGPATCHLLVQFMSPIRKSVFGIFDIRTVAEPALSSCWKTQCCQGQHLVIWKTPKLWQGQHFYLVESISTVAKASRSTNSASRASILPSGRHQSCGRAAGPVLSSLLEVPTVLSGPTSCHLAGMKLVTRPPLFFCGKYQQCCQGEHLVICKTSNFWQEARASNVSSGRHQTCGRVMPGPASCHLCAVFVFHLQCLSWYFRHQNCGRTSTFIMLEVHSVARANTLSSGRHQNCGKDNNFTWLKVSTVLPRPAEVPTVLPGPASCHLEDIKVVK